MFFLPSAPVPLLRCMRVALMRLDVIGTGISIVAMRGVAKGAAYRRFCIHRLPASCGITLGISAARGAVRCMPLLARGPDGAEGDGHHH